MMKFAQEKMHAGNDKGSYATVLQNRRLYRGLYRRTLASMYTEGYILGQLIGACMYVCMHVQAFSFIAQKRMDASTCGLHCRVHRNEGTLLLMTASRHVHVRMHHARAREPMQILIICGRAATTGSRPCAC